MNLTSPGGLSVYYIIEIFNVTVNNQNQNQNQKSSML